ncbi:hypothetical protein [Streptomyces caniscabiei]|uniref:Uncharacterized protein n=1 Tax=Streptomyces caniscabiei TaxID=2746961 RepID=A0ABU4MIX1_9ACTN|nr:hypothetical protein [Streptomyces caniscabiei]MBE4790981.1 hypothetical protein [Streptomyces caniscabiei]MDX3009608.1 hypothetical protein [Streptomyces caniscabiei]MDX3037253.1 hypothetical protein [Streptomyces caniscabiei]
MTSTYRKKPIPVRALQLTPDSYRQILDTLTSDQFTAGGENTDGTVFVEVRSLEGVMHAAEDDWIVWDTHGHVWVVRAGIFTETYEPVYAEEASAEERIARRLAAGDYCVPGDEPDDTWWNNRPPRFRLDYLAHARRVIALVRAEDQLAAAARADVLAEEAEHLRTVVYPAVYDDAGQKAADGVAHAAGELRRRARELRRTAADQGQPS